MTTLNKVILIGYLTQNPDLQTSSNLNAKSRCKFTIITKDKNETEQHSVVSVGKQADLAGKSLKKGDYVLVEGRIHYWIFQDNGANEHLITEIIPEKIQLLDISELKQEFDGSIVVSCANRRLVIKQ
jgi:single-strand DNA-binding protein